MDYWPVAHATGPRVRVMVVVGIIVAIAIWLVALDPLNPGAAAQEAAVRTAILTDMTAAALPSGATPGHLDPATLAGLHSHVDEVLPTAFTGPLLDLKRHRLSDIPRSARDERDARRQRRCWHRRPDDPNSTG